MMNQPGKQALLQTNIHLLRTTLQVVKVFTPAQLKKQRVNIVYKVDRLGDWILAERAITEVLKPSTGSNLLIVEKSLAARVGRSFPKETIVGLEYDGDGLRVTLRNLRALIALAVQYRCVRLVSFRHQIGPLREIALSSISATTTIALDEEGVELRANYPWLSVDKNARSRLPNETTEDLSLELKRHQLLLSLLGLPPETEVRPRFEAAEKIQRRNVVMIAPFGTARIRDLPDSHWTQLCRNLASKVTFDRYELWVTRGHRDMAAALAEKIQTQSHVPTQIRTAVNLDQLEHAIAQVRCILTVETAVAHIAVAHDRPTAVFIGGGEFRQFGPWRWSSKQIWVANIISCFNCQWNCSLSVPECIHGISIAGLESEIEAAIQLDQDIG